MPDHEEYDVEQYCDNDRNPISRMQQLFNEQRRNRRQRHDNDSEKEKKLTFEEHLFDAVVIANGHFTKPFIPNIPGLQQLIHKDKDKHRNDARLRMPRVLHAHAYREAADYRNRDCLVVGGSHSGIDIANEISRYSASTTVSVKRGEKYSKLWDMICSGVANKRPDEPNYLHRLKRVGQIKHIDLDDDDAARCRVHFDDDDADGETAAQIFHVIIFCTGYEYVCPFLSEELKVKDTALCKHIFHPDIPDGTLSFAGIPRCHPAQRCIMI